MPEAYFNFIAPIKLCLNVVFSGQIRASTSSGLHHPFAGLRNGARFSYVPGMDAYAKARELIDAAHDADPKSAADGRAAERVYADRMEAWVARIAAPATPLLRLAARCQHLERWSVPRATFPEGKVGYLTWRRSLYVKQAARAKELLLQAGVSENEAGEVATWVSKSDLKTNAGTQALEDAACLVFLENEIEDFAAQHAGYPAEKFVDIIKKTWRKMSPAAQHAAVGLSLRPDIAALVKAAVAQSK